MNNRCDNGICMGCKRETKEIVVMVFYYDKDTPLEARWSVCKDCQKIYFVKVDEENLPSKDKK